MAALYSDFFVEDKQLVEQYLDEHLPSADNQPRVFFESMRYSVLNGGKRLRPVLILETADMLGSDKNRVLPFAAAVEMIHSYSLIHDDLPAMDNDDFRRGQPTSHKVYGEANAILAGDAILTHSFYELTELGQSFEPANVLKLIGLVSRYAGIDGMVKGQSADINKTSIDHDTEKSVLFIHKNKTARLITLCFEGTAALTGAPAAMRLDLKRAGEQLGLAFQIQDDILDATGDAKKMGKDTKSDSKNDTLTYLSIADISAAQEKVRELAATAKKIFKGFEKSDKMIKIIEKIEWREK